MRSPAYLFLEMIDDIVNTLDIDSPDARVHNLLAALNELRDAIAELGPGLGTREGEDLHPAPERQCSRYAQKVSTN